MSVTVEDSVVGSDAGAWDVSGCLGACTPVDEAVKVDSVVNDASDIGTASVNLVTDEVSVFNVELGKLLAAPDVASDESDDFVEAIETLSSLSGQIPVVHGSLEQHPR